MLAISPLMTFLFLFSFYGQLFNILNEITGYFSFPHISITNTEIVYVFTVGKCCKSTNAFR